MNQLQNQLLWVVDLLLPFSVALFLLPVDPRLSTLPIAFWLIFQLIVSDRSSRLIKWIMLSLFLFSARDWWFNNPPHPASFSDAVLLFSGLLASMSITADRWNRIFLLPAFGSIPLLLTLSAKPWTPNPFVGSNQAAYLFGLFLSVLIISLFLNLKSIFHLFLLLPMVVVQFIFLWQTGSRAALISLIASCSIAFLVHQASKHQFWKSFSLLSVLGVLAYALRSFLSTNSTLPGLKTGSDSARLLVFDCFAQLPFTGNNRFVYGVGFDRINEFCSSEYQGSTLDHAHNLYLQIWASTGFFGLVAILLPLIILLSRFRLFGQRIPETLQMCWQAALLYTLFQGLFDVSLLHWPITMIYTGIVIGLPFSFNSEKELMPREKLI